MLHLFSITEVCDHEEDLGMYSHFYQIGDEIFMAGGTYCLCCGHPEPSECEADIIKQGNIGDIIEL